MTRRLVITVDAARELAEVAAWIHAENPEAGLRLLDAFRGVKERLLHLPESAPLFRHPKAVALNLRVLRVPGFPSHLIFYRVLEEEVRVLHVVHGARDLPAFLKLDQPPGP